MVLASGCNAVVLRSFWHVMAEGSHAERDVVLRLPDGDVEVFRDGAKYTPKEALASYLAEVS